MLSGMARAGGLAATSGLAAAASAAAGGLAAQLLPAAATAASRLLQRRGVAWSVEREPQVWWCARIPCLLLAACVPRRTRRLGRADHTCSRLRWPGRSRRPRHSGPHPFSPPQKYKSVDDIIQDRVIVESLEKTREAAKDPARIRDILAAAKERSFLTDHKPGAAGAGWADLACGLAGPLACKLQVL